MRSLPVLLVLALVGLVATPSAAAATFDLGASKIMETALDPGEDAVFEMPLTVNQDGFLYAKVLPTPGNAVNDGSKANGSLADGSGWSVSFAIVKADGARIEMGTFVDSSTSTLVPVAIGEKLTLVSTVHVPEDAARGGPQQRAYVAVAYRLNDDTNGGGNSGGVLDEAKALTLILSNALLPPAEQIQPTPSPSAPQQGGAQAPPPTDGGEGASGDGGSGGDVGGDEGNDGSGPEESTVPPVSALPSTTLVNVAPLPSWFLGGALFLGAALVIVLGVLAASVATLARAQAGIQGTSARDAASPTTEAREVRVERESARIEIRSAREE